MIKEHSDEFVTQIARLCYIDKVPQQKVAQMMNVSQAKISRILTLAKERGIVQISVKKFTPNIPNLEKKIKKKYNLKNVIVIKIPKEISENNRREILGHYGAKIFSNRFQELSSIGITGGKTIKEFLSQVNKNDFSPSCTIHQLMGNVVSNIDANDASELGRALAEKINGNFNPYNSPALVEDKTVRQSLFKIPQIKDLYQQFKNIEMAIIGIGDLENSIFMDAKSISKKDLHQLKKEGVIGEVCGHFYNKKGKEASSLLKERIMSIDLTVLKNIPVVLGVTSGIEKADALKAALNGSLISAIIIDEPLANELIK